MPFSEKQLFLKKSQLPFAGMGLFTRHFIVRHTRIIEYKGRITTWKNILEEEEKSGIFNGYVYYVNRYHVIDARHRIKALARYANDAAGIKKRKGVTNNCRFIKDGLRVFIKAMKDISAGEEILIRYGKDYWNGITTIKNFQ